MPSNVVTELTLRKYLKRGEMRKVSTANQEVRDARGI